MTDSKIEYIAILEILISDSVKIIIFDQDDRNLFDLVCKKIKSKKMENIEVWHCFNEAVSYPKTRLLNIEQMGGILELYHLYDFSNKVTVLTSNVQYASMINYVKTGLLTMDEMVEAILS